MAVKGLHETFLPMRLEFKPSISSRFKSRSQQARVATESWFGANGYCIACIGDSLFATKPNTVVHDFTCELCQQKYELKSSLSPQNKRVPDGAYSTMIETIREGDAPSLILLRYERESAEADAAWGVVQLRAIHPVFLTELTIEARTRLRPPARRAGWQGCNIRLDRIPSDGLISLVIKKQPVNRIMVRNKFASARKFAELDTGLRGWAGLTLAIVRRLGSVFTLQQVYAIQGIAKEVFPNNSNIEAKLRQQLQLLRDLGFIEFLGRGKYAVVDPQG